MTATVALVHDAGPAAGLGHLRRMEALATALSSRGAVCHTVPVAAPAPVADVTVVDSYRVRADEHGRWSSPIMVAVDDIERDLAVDLVVDPNPRPDPGAGGQATTTLTGPRYALVGPIDTDVAPVPLGEEVRTVVVTFGAAGAGGLGAEVAGALVDRLPGARVLLTIGPWGGEVPAGVEPVVTDAGLLPVLAHSDLVVTAGGVTLLEALLLGRPTVVVATAPNQRRAVEGAVAAGAAATFIGLPSAAALVEAVLGLVADPVRRAALAAAAGRHVDGGGPDRVSEAILGLL